MVLSPKQAETVSFIARREFNAGHSPKSVAVADFNGDGLLDLAVTDDWYGNLPILLGNGDGTFQEPIFAVAPTSASVTVGDFNGDGIPDLAVTYSTLNSVSVLLGIGDGTFQSAQRYSTGGAATFVTTGDFNGDGIADLAV